MSDYFSRNVSYGQNFYTNFCRHIGQTRDDSNICFNERGKGEYYKAYNHVHRDLPRVGMPRERREFSERLDFENLGRLSSNLVQFLSTARHNADKSYNTSDSVYIPPNDNSWTNRTPNDANQVGIESIRKEKHNKVERRRRTVLNERFTELRNLLPEEISRATLGRKSIVLKEAIAYIRKLQKDIEQIQQLEDQFRTSSRDVSEMSQRLDTLEMQKETIPAFGKKDVQTSISYDNTVGTSDLILSDELNGDTNKSIFDISMPQHTLYTECTSYLVLEDVLDEASSPLPVDTASPVHSDFELEFDF